MYKKEKKNTNNYTEESNLDLFASNLDHSQCNSCTAVRRGGNCSQAKNTIVFGLDNKRRKPYSLQTKSTSSFKREYQAGVIDNRNTLQDAIETALTGVQNKLNWRRVKMAADGTFLVFCDTVGSLFVVFLGSLFCKKRLDTFPLSSLITQQLSMCLSDWWPPIFSTSIPPFLSQVFHALCRGNPAGMLSLLLSSKTP